VRADFAVLAEHSRGLSGGDRLNVCVNAIYAGSVDPDSAKGEHSGGEEDAEEEGRDVLELMGGDFAFPGAAPPHPAPWLGGAGPLWIDS
jgi:hypothetical protein